MSSRLLAVSLAMLGLCGCSTIHKNIGQEDPGFGETVKYNAALETINPVPVYGPDGAQPSGNGDNGAQAVKRYRTNQVKQVESMGTTSGSGSGGSPR